MEYRIDDKMLNASAFLTFVNQVWPGDYDIDNTGRGKTFRYFI